MPSMALRPIAVALLGLIVVLYIQKPAHALTWRSTEAFISDVRVPGPLSSTESDSKVIVSGTVGYCSAWDGASVEHQSPFFHVIIGKAKLSEECKEILNGPAQVFQREVSLGALQPGRHIIRVYLDSTRAYQDIPLNVN